MSNHSPIPYKIKRNHTAGNIVHLAILAANGDMPCSITPQDWCRPVDEANAEFICRACNNHNKLVEALKDVVFRFEHNGDESTEDKAALDAAQVVINHATKETR